LFGKPFKTLSLKYHINKQNKLVSMSSLKYHFVQISLFVNNTLSVDREEEKTT